MIINKIIVCESGKMIVLIFKKKKKSVANVCSFNCMYVEVQGFYRGVYRFIILLRLHSIEFYGKLTSFVLFFNILLFTLSVHTHFYIILVINY